MKTMKKLLDDLAFALNIGSARQRRALELRREVEEADRDRALGVMAMGSRGSVLISREQVESD